MTPSVGSSNTSSSLLMGGGGGSEDNAMRTVWFVSAVTAIVGGRCGRRSH